MQQTNNTQIQSLEQLQATIKQVQARISQREDELILRVKQMPGELLRATGEAILPIFMGKELASGLIKLIKSGINWIRGKQNDSEKTQPVKEQLTEDAKKMGILALIKFFLNIWKTK